MRVIDVVQGRNLQTEVLQQMNVDDINSAARSYRPDLRASPADVLVWAGLWNESTHFSRAHVMQDGDILFIRLEDD